MVIANCIVLKSPAKVRFNLQYMNCSIRISNSKLFSDCLYEWEDDFPDDSVIHTMSTMEWLSFIVACVLDVYDGFHKILNQTCGFYQ